AADETALELAYTDDCGTVTATFVSESFTVGSTQCAWTLERIYTISDGCPANDFNVTLSYAGGDDGDPYLLDPLVDCSSLDLMSQNLCDGDFDPSSLLDEVEALYTDNCDVDLTVTVT